MVAPHIVSWGPAEYKRPISPVPSTVGSIVSIESISSDTSIIPQSVSEVSRRHMESMPRKVPPGVQPVDSPFLRHEKYFFPDGNITFLIDGTLYCVHRYFFARHSEYFSSRLAQFSIREHEALAVIISLGDVERKDFEAFLSVIYPDDFEGHNLSYEQWKSVLDLSTRWRFVSLRRLALGSIEPPTPFDQLLLARAYSVKEWVLPALSELCERTVPLSLSEARQMSIEDVVLVNTVREDIRHHTLHVDLAEIPNCIEAAQAGMAAIAAGARANNTSRPPAGWSSSSSGSMAAFVADDEDDVKTAVSLSPVDVRRKDGMLTSPVPVRPAEERPRPAPTSAWDKILVVPSPTLSVQPHLPAWGGTWGASPGRQEPQQGRNPWRRPRVQTAHLSSSESVLSGFARDGLSDEERG